MPPKKAATAKTPTGSAHPPYAEMIKEAIINRKDRQGSSRQALKKYVQANNNLQGVSDNAFTVQFNKALQRGSESGIFARPKGPSGPVKLAGPKTTETKATKTTTKAPAAAKAKKTTTAKSTATKKAPAKKAPAPKKTTATKAKAPAKKTTNAKANTGASRKPKTPAAAPAVEEKAPVVLGKTKSGRVTKSSAPQVPRKALASAAKKRAAPKKKATPKKA